MYVVVDALVVSSNISEKLDKQGNTRTYCDVYDRKARALVKLSITDKKPFIIEDGAMGNLSGELRQGTFEGRNFLVLTQPKWEIFKK